MKNEKVKQKIKYFINKIKGMNKRYYLIFGMFVLFLLYNMITLRGLYYDKNEDYGGGYFAFMDTWHGYTNVSGWTYDELELGRGYVGQIYDVHDVQEANHWYGSIFGTLVFMQWKWIGIHVGDYMILIDTWVPNEYYGEDHIFGHPYYTLRRYDSYWEINEIRRCGETGSEDRIDNSQYHSRNIRHWIKNVDKYRRNTLIFYGIVVVVMIVLSVRMIWHRRRRQSHKV